MEPIALTISGTSKAISCGKTTTYKLIQEGKLKVVKIGRRTLVTVASIRALVEGSPSQSGAGGLADRQGAGQ